MPEMRVPVTVPLSGAPPPLAIAARRVRQRTVSRGFVGSYALHAPDGRK
jgi:hypothetical protein